MKTIKKIFLTLFFLLNNYQLNLFAQQNIRIGEWINDWFLIGPFTLGESIDNINHLPNFNNDFLKEFGGETNFNFDVDKNISVDGEKLKWQKYSSNDSIVNLDEAISRKSYITAYAYKEIEVEKSDTYIFALGTNDGGKLWINDKEIWDHQSGRGLKPDEDLIPVHLEKGKNKILLKIEERGNYWGFCARILPFNIDSFLSKDGVFEIVSMPNGNSELRFSLIENVINDLFEFVNLKLFDDDLNMIWEEIWNKKSKMQLPILKNEYRPYCLKITANRNDNKLWQKEIKFFSGIKKNYTLFENRKTDYRIVVSNSASESEKWAAEELSKTLKEISDAEFSIENDNSNISEKEIIIGFNKHSSEILGNDFSKPFPTDESFIYKNIGSNIVLIGGEERGTMYAVFSFLENELGVRWYTPQVTSIPKRERYNFSYLNFSEFPSIRVRNDFYYEAFDPVWAVHNKINGAMGTRDQIGGVEGYWSVHTFYRFMPPSEYFDEHPEYYSLIDGERIHENAQLCLTNPNVLKIITEKLKEVMRNEPGNLIYSVSQNDWRNPCQCNSCQAKVEKEGTESGIMVWFVNQVADNIKEEFPNKFVGTLAYQYTRKPPKNIKPRENVVIRLCSIECCFAHDFKSCPENQEFLSDLEGWSAIAPHLYIWDYVVNFSHYILPYPNFNVLQSNIKTFQENNSIGIMEQAAYQSRGGEFAELRAYLISKLLWNSEADVEKVIDDFVFGYYARSGQFIKEYFDLLHSQLNENTHIHLGLRTDDILFSEDFIHKADLIFDKAEIIADNDEIKQRVEMARLPLLYLKCSRFPVNSKYDGTYDKFNEIVKREGITHFAEAGKPHIDAFHNFVNNSK
ncbi:MAG: DUF4838 domain-containing protein [Ignavibacteriales bacterium]|nr:DUF4838 domain-containing protein [Ignavibacteriales bacterium]MCB9218336.1 DUF4838 domain-containing protein [Ignavibacteriales bacterium]MCB9260632.1 DUF4838 domain-containing protein [Ignavibacteriales bacterium]